MTSIAPIYWARAFRKALRDGQTSEQELVDNVHACIQRYGLSRKRAAIVRHIAKEIVHHTGGRWIMVEAARALTGTQREKLRRMFSSNDYIEERIRPDLIAGIRIVMDDEQEFNVSLKRKLDNIL